MLGFEGYGSRPTTGQRLLVLEDREDGEIQGGQKARAREGGYPVITGKNRSRLSIHFSPNSRVVVYYL